MLEILTSISSIEKTILEDNEMIALNLDSNKKGLKVFVGLSGGVDSAVSAHLLKQAGFKVTGVFIDIWQPDFTACTAETDRRDAMRVAAKLDIDFFILDCREPYRLKVVDYMVSSYRSGQTPNPDIICNSSIKFGVFAKEAFKQGADFIATGHYAGIDQDQGKPVLTEGRDVNKDQSYFLWNIEPDILGRVIFPLKDKLKPEIRSLAREISLPVAEKSDSQGVCFLGPVDMKSFLSSYLPTKTGDVLDQTGQRIGRHDGVWFYTLGQRHGLLLENKSPNTPVMYVIKKDLKSNTLTVSSSRSETLSQETKITNTNWFKEPERSKEYLVRVRHRGVKHPCRLKQITDTDWLVETLDAGDILTPGQSMVIYDQNKCLGGGVMI